MRTVKPRRSCRVPLSRILLGCDSGNSSRNSLSRVLLRGLLKNDRAGCNWAREEEEAGEGRRWNKQLGRHAHQGGHQQLGRPLIMDEGLSRSVSRAAL